MAKKRREEDEVERLQREVRELKATNRTLMRKLKKLDRNYVEELEKESQEEQVKRDYNADKDRVVARTCKDCGKGTIEITEIRGRKFASCSQCGPKGKMA